MLLIFKSRSGSTYRKRTLPEILAREVRVIELLAHDAKAKMKLAVGGS